MTYTLEVAYVLRDILLKKEVVSELRLLVHVNSFFGA